MLQHLSVTICRHPWLVIVSWLALLVGLRTAQYQEWIPRWSEVALDGDLAHLPGWSSSVRGNDLMRRAFPTAIAHGRMVIVVARRDRPLDATDRAISDRLADLLRERMPAPTAARESPDALPIVDLWTRRTEGVGKLLRSQDKQAELIILHLSNEFMATDNIRVLESIQSILANVALESPIGLQLGITGSAAIGGDMFASARDSIASTERVTIALVILILFVVYRSPLLVLVPLLAIITSIVTASGVIAMLTQSDGLQSIAGWQPQVYKTTWIFIVVILFGAGTDYCLFLISRFKEELRGGVLPPDAAHRALDNVAAALTARALTTIVGLAMMYFAHYQKFSNTGPVIAIALLITLTACLTLAPAILVVMGAYVTWPFSLKANAGHRVPQPRWTSCWERVADAVLSRPWLLLVCASVAMTPLAVKGWQAQHRVTYDLLGELQQDRPGVMGTNLFRQHFPVGEIGPVALLIQHQQPVFAGTEGREIIARWTKFLYQLPDVVSVRSLSEPFGDPPADYAGLLNARENEKRFVRSLSQTKHAYLSSSITLADRVARFDLVLGSDPFAIEAIQALTRIETALNQYLATTDEDGSFTFEMTGTTVGLRDLKRITLRDQRTIQILVLLAVLMILVAVLRRPIICLLLLTTVLASYYVTMGATEWFFSWLYGASFHGLDWKVPIFLFVILIAVGQDYNIYLATRVFEEQGRHGDRPGLRLALVRTGGIITSCGVIMAGTFLSLTTGALRGMQELGFALSLGILLDTLVVRTVLVPTLFAIVAQYRESALLPR